MAETINYPAPHASIVGKRFDNYPPEDVSGRGRGKAKNTCGKTATSDKPAPTFELSDVTDLANARRLEATADGKLLYCYPWGKWLVWDGVRWKPDDTFKVMRFGVDVVKNIYSEAGRSTDENDRIRLAKHATRTESEHAMKAMISLGRSLMPIRPEELDGDPWLLNVKNGTVDLRNGELRPHERSDHITQVANVKYDRQATCPRFAQFL
ncbi:MAG: hypothetical protein IIA01_04835, partial [Proteobacteria bacterium]|nr:hypothetical protein [Pseudomonadota bacterium]